MSELSRMVGRRIRALRVKRKLSQERLAEKCGMHPTYIGQLERGEKNATLESLVRVSAALGVPVTALLEDMDYREGGKPTNASLAYDLMEGLTTREQEAMLDVMRRIIEFKDIFIPKRSMLR